MMHTQLQMNNFIIHVQTTHTNHTTDVRTCSALLTSHNQPYGLDIEHITYSSYTSVTYAYYIFIHKCTSVCSGEILAVFKNGCGYHQCVRYYVFSILCVRVCS